MGNKKKNVISEEQLKILKEELKIELEKQLKKELEKISLSEKILKEESKDYSYVDLRNLSEDERDKIREEMYIDTNNFKKIYSNIYEMEKECDEKMGEIQSQQFEEVFKEYLNNTTEEKTMHVVSVYPVDYGPYAVFYGRFFKKLECEHIRGGEKSFKFRCNLLERMNLQEVEFLFLPIAWEEWKLYNTAYKIEINYRNTEEKMITIFYYKNTIQKHRKILSYSLIICGTFDNINKNIFMIRNVEAINVKSHIKIYYDIYKPVNLSKLFRRGINLIE